MDTILVELLVLIPGAIAVGFLGPPLYVRLIRWRPALDVHLSGMYAALILLALGQVMVTVYNHRESGTLRSAWFFIILLLGFFVAETRYLWRWLYRFADERLFMLPAWIPATLGALTLASMVVVAARSSATVDGIRAYLLADLIIAAGITALVIGAQTWRRNRQRIVTAAQTPVQEQRH